MKIAGFRSLFIFLIFIFVFSIEAAPVSRQTCLTSKCHADIKVGKSVHGPVKAAGCTVCHTLRSANLNATKHPDLNKLEMTEINKLCITCHDNFKEGENGFIPHSAISKKTCLSCHDSHHSVNASLLLKSTNELCLSCHKLNLTLPQVHGPLRSNGKCSQCHDPHGTSHKNLLHKREIELCLSCHDKSIKKANGEKIADMKTFLKKNKHHHDPIENGRCATCHDSHVSEYDNLTKLLYENKNYSSDKFLKSVSLCFKCHKVDLVTKAKADKETNFRNGSVNLHHLHVLGGKKVRSCRVCHDSHGSESEYLIRRNFMSKGFEIPTDFKKSVDGGSCATMCHNRKRYSRTSEVVNE
ncbi:MAG: hypothetical protein A2Z20_04505 [Bdellovibrionales bacterium RBG_16_40_8]|nr:MAG: hypothetical protein A2Z20_04505 [Bdellovibrionales bacterium RBG_16_40_8]